MVYWHIYLLAVIVIFEDMDLLFAPLPFWEGPYLCMLSATRYRKMQTQDHSQLFA
jgi:hypothetical protein